MGEWLECKLGDVLSFVSKGTTPNEKMGGFANAGVNYIKSDAISYDGRIDKTQFVKISNHVHQALKRSQLKKDDVLFSMAGAYMGKTGIITEEMLPANTNQAVAILRARTDKILVKFMGYHLRLPTTIDYVNNLSGQSAQPNINFEEIKSLMISLPTVAEQKAIAEVLSSLDDKIDLLHRQNKTLESLAETLFRHWFIDGAQDDWEMGALGSLISISSGKGLKRSDFDETGKYKVLGANGEIGKCNTFNFDERLLFTGRVGTLGNIFIVNERAWLSDNTLVIKVPASQNFYFVYFTLKMADLGSMNVGSTQPLIRQSEVKEIQVLAPDSNLLEQFHTVCEVLFEKLEQNKQQITKQEKLRDTLLPKLMSGDVRVAYEAAT